MKVVITGASSGIGYAIGEALISDQHEVWGLSRRDAGPAGARRTTCDVSDWSDVNLARAQIQDQWGSIDALICAAGIQGEMGPAKSVDPRAWSKTVQANIDGTFFPIRALVPLLLTQVSEFKRNKIICFSGGGATSPRPNFSAYGCAKTAIVRLVDTLALEWRSDPLDINAIAPGAISTEMTAEVLRRGEALVGSVDFAAAQKTLASGLQPLQKALALIRFLLSQESDGLSGKLISAPWDDWASFPGKIKELQASDLLTLRRIL